MDVAQLMSRMIDGEDDMRSVGYLLSADGLPAHVAERKPRVILLDRNMPGRDSMEALRELAAEFADVRVIVFSGDDDAASVEAALSCGAWGYLSKDAEPAGIVNAIRRVAEGEVVLPGSARLDHER